MHRYHRRAFAFSGLLIYLLISQLAMPALVMCFGGNGHLAVEATHAPAASSETPEHGGPCLDTPVLVARADGRAANLLSDFFLSAHLPLFHVFAAFSSHAASCSPLSLACCRAWVPQSHLTSLPSVLLLI
jgi:hypothetical protein